MAEQVLAFQLPRIRPQKALQVLAAAADVLAVLERGGFSIQFHSENIVNFIQPHRDEVPRGDRAEYENACNRLLGALTSEAKVNFNPLSNPAARQSKDLSLPLKHGACLLLLLISEKGPPDPEEDEEEEDTSEQLIIVNDQIDLVAETAARIITRVRHVAEAMVSQETGFLAAFFHVPSPEVGAMPDGLRTAPTTARLIYFRRYQFGRAVLHLPQDRHLGTAALSHGAAALSYLASALEPHEAAMAFGPEGGIDLYLIERETAVSAYFEPELAPTAERLDVRLHEIRASEEAIKELNDTINARNFPVGYLVRLHRLEDYAYSTQTFLDLQEQMDDLAVRINLLSALEPAARFETLFRFSNAQLKPMIDALSMLDQEHTNDGSILYAATHPTGMDSVPIHYLMCSPDIASSFAGFAESIWAQRTEPRPMRFWIDPLWADYAVRTNDVHSALYVPVHHSLTPSLGSFGGDFEETLRTVMGEKFEGIRDFVTDKGNKPLFVVAKVPDKPGDLSIEVVDRNAFQPLKIAIKWLNDYLQLHTARTIAPEDLAAVAQNLYTHSFADEIADEAKLREMRIAGLWETIHGETEDKLDKYAAHLQEEMQSLRDHTDVLLKYLASMQDRLTDMDTLVQSVNQAMTKGDAQLVATSELTSDLAQWREEIRLALAKEIDRGEQLSRRVKEKVKNERKVLRDLRRGRRPLKRRNR